MKTSRSYAEMIRFDTFEERFEYLKLDGVVGADTFGRDRFLCQEFYHWPEWLAARQQVIVRDYGRDLAVPGRDIPNGRLILVHHLNPITPDDILEHRACLTDLNNLVCVSKRTHDAIHYGNASLYVHEQAERHANDTCPWKGGRL